MSEYNIITELALRNGKPCTLNVPEGEYTLNEGIFLGPNQWLVGQGPGTILNFTNNIPLAVKLATGSKIKNCVVRGSGGNGIGISTTETSAFWAIDGVNISGFDTNIFLRNSYVGVIRDVISMGAKAGLRVDWGFQTSTKVEGNCYFGGNEWGLIISGMSNMTLSISAVIEGNTLGGMKMEGDCRQLSIKNCHFEKNGPNSQGPDLLIQGLAPALTIAENAFFFSKVGIKIENARKGQVIANYFKEKNSMIVASSVSSTLDIRNNDQSGGGNVGYTYPYDVDPQTMPTSSSAK